YLAANSTNSERALQMAIEAANTAGGVGGRPLHILARDTRSDPAQVTTRARELVDAGAVLFFGPDAAELAVPLVPLLKEKTVILPSFTTGHAPFRKPDWWYLMGAGTARIACELHAQLQADHRVHPLVITDPNGYTNLVAWELIRTYSMERFVLPVEPSTTTTVQP